MAATIHTKVGDIQVICCVPGEKLRKRMSLMTRSIRHRYSKREKRRKNKQYDSNDSSGGGKESPSPPYTPTEECGGGGVVG